MASVEAGNATDHSSEAAPVAVIENPSMSPDCAQNGQLMNPTCKLSRSGIPCVFSPALAEKVAKKVQKNEITEKYYDQVQHQRL
jgi:hypothetical protein